MADYREHGLQVNGATFRCFVCGTDRFVWREIKMQTTGVSFLGLDWANASADGAICVGCGYVHQFYGEHHQFIRLEKGKR